MDNNNYYKKKFSILYIINNLVGSKNLLKPYTKLLICVSGGQDSIFLIHILYQLKKKWNWKFAVIHCDHQWNSISKLQANYVSQLTTNMNVDYYQAISNQKITSEENARDWRYSIIKKIAHYHKCQFIITAHTKNDRVETFLAHLLRGSGMNGLKSINWEKKIVNKIYIKMFFLINTVLYNISYQEDIYKCIKIQSFTNKIIRPLLNITREHIFFLIKSWKSPIWYDPTNRFLKMSRNRIRHRLIPYTKFYFNPKIDQSIFQSTEISLYQNNYLIKISKYLLNKIQLIVLDNKTEKYLALDFQLLSSLPIFLQREMIKAFLEKNLKIKIIFHQVEYLRLRYFFLKKKYLMNDYKNNNKNFTKYISITFPQQNIIKINTRFLLVEYSKKLIKKNNH